MDDVADTDGFGEFVALYLPATTRSEKPTRRGFQSQEAAEEYIFTQMCNGCKEDRALALKGFEENSEGEPTSLWPGCACEWDVYPATDFEPDQLNSFISVTAEAVARG